MAKALSGALKVESDLPLEGCNYEQICTDDCKRTLTEGLLHESHVQDDLEVAPVESTPSKN